MPRDKKDLPPEQIYSGSMKVYVLAVLWDEVERVTCGLPDLCEFAIINPII